MTQHGAAVGHPSGRGAHCCTANGDLCALAKTVTVKQKETVSKTSGWPEPYGSAFGMQLLGDGEVVPIVFAAGDA